MADSRLRPFYFFMMKITIRQIIRWEQLRKKTFNEFDTSVDDDVIALMYVTSKPFEINDSLFETYKDVALEKPELVKKHADDIGRYFGYINQFSEKAPEEPIDPMALKSEEPVDDSKVSISEVAMNLLYSGVDARYLMDDVELCDLPMLARGSESAMRRKLEDHRLWTFLMVSPYLDSSCKKTTDFYPFPWEEEGKHVIVSGEDLQMAESILSENKERKDKDNG